MSDKSERMNTTQFAALADVERALVVQVFRTLFQCAVEGKTVVIRNFGKFVPRDYAPRTIKAPNQDPKPLGHRRLVKVEMTERARGILNGAAREAALGPGEDAA